MPKIIPAILAKSIDELAYCLKVVSSFADYVHIDVADGEFVPNITAKPEHLKEIAPEIDMEIHLMVKNPLDWVEWYDLQGVKKIAFHFESADDPGEVIAKIREYTWEPILVINPTTSVDQINYLVERVEGVQVMTVDPGFQGGQFVGEALKKVDQLKQKYPDLPVSVDGGVHESNIAQVLTHPTNQIVVGSEIIQSESPEAEYSKLEEIAANTT